MTDINQVSLVKTKIINYLNNKYPESFSATGITDSGIETLVKRIFNDTKTSKTETKEKVNNLIALLERKIKENMYSENRIKRTVNTNQYTMDPATDITYKTYIDKPFSTIPESLKDPTSAINNSYQSQFEIDKESVLNAAGVDKNNILRSQFKDLMEPLERPFIYNIIIDSKDRDIVKFPNPSSFVIDFSPPDSKGTDINKGYINTAFGNIISCELLDIVLLDTATECDSSDSTGSGNSVPYIVLEIPELGNTYYGTNDELNRCFATLTTYELMNGYKYYNINAINSNHTITKVYNPRINLNRMTIKLKLPDGTLYSFGSANNASTSTVFKMSFRITTLQKNLSTGFINKALY